MKASIDLLKWIILRIGTILYFSGGALARVRQPEAAEAAHGRRLDEQAGRQERRHLRGGRDGTTG